MLLAFIALKWCVCIMSSLTRQGVKFVHDTTKPNFWWPMHCSHTLMLCSAPNLTHLFLLWPCCSWSAHTLLSLRAHPVMWAKTAASKGGARDPAAAPANRLGHILSDMAELEAGGADAALMSAQGFRAYAQEGIWVS